MTYKIRRLHNLDHENGSTLEDGCRFVNCLPPGILGNVDGTHITVPAGRRTRPHLHWHSTCFVFVVDGSGIARLNGDERRVALNDFIVIRPGTSHGFEAGPEPLTLLSLHGPSLANGTEDIDLEFV